MVRDYLRLTGADNPESVAAEIARRGPTLRPTVLLVDTVVPLREALLADAVRLLHAAGRQAGLSLTALGEGCDELVARLVAAGLSVLELTVPAADAAGFDRFAGRERAFAQTLSGLKRIRARTAASRDAPRSFPTLLLRGRIPLEPAGMERQDALAGLLDRLLPLLHRVRLELWPQRGPGRSLALPRFEAVTRFTQSLLRREQGGWSHGRAAIGLAADTGLPLCLLHCAPELLYAFRVGPGQGDGKGRQGRDREDLDKRAAGGQEGRDREDLDKGAAGGQEGRDREDLDRRVAEDSREARGAASAGPCGACAARSFCPTGLGVDPRLSAARHPWRDSLRAFEELPSSLYFGAGGTGPAESLGRRVLYVGRHRHASFHEFVLAQADAHLWGTPTASRIEIGPADVRPLQAYPRDFPVLLARLPCTEREQMEGATLIPPLSLIQLHSRLAAEAIPVTVVDLAAEAVVQGVTHPDRSPDPETIARFCQDRLCLEARRQRGFSLAGLSVENTSALALAERLSAALEIAPHIVVGGRGVVSAAEVLERCPHVDFAVGGEGDWPLLLLVRALAGGMEPRAIPGLAQRVAGTTVAHPGAWHDLDLVAPPDLTWINRSFYPDTKFPFRGEPVVPYMFVHGCPYRCAFCGDWTGGLMRTRSPARVVSDLDRMRRELGQRNFLFLNTLLNSSPSYLGELLSAMASARLDIQWADSAKPRNLSADTLRELRRLGCVALTWGIDAATPHLCRRMDKGFDLEEASQIIRWSREAGIDNVVNLIAGLPHETDQDIRETIAWLERHRAFVSHVNLMPFQFIENSLLFVHPERYGIVKTADGRGFDEVDGLPWAEKQDQIMRSYNLIDRTTGDLGYCRVTGTGEPTLH